MGFLDKILGPLLIGNWINSFLFMWEILQVITYYKNYSDPWPFKLLIAFAITIDFVSTLNSFIMVYLYSVTNWGKLLYVIKTHWPLPVEVLTVTISTTIVQAFLIHRYWSISKNIYVTTLLLLVLLASFAGGVGSTVGFCNPALYGISSLTDNFLKMWLITTSSCGVLVAASLVFELSRVRTAFKSTKSLVRKLSANAIQAGLAPAFIDMITLFCYLKDKESNVGMGFALCAGRVYTLTMLWNLNMRRRKTTNKPLPGAPGDLSDSLHMTGIHIHRTAIVHIDDDKAAPSLTDHGVVEKQDSPDSDTKSISLQLREPEESHVRFPPS
ncbi:hypothetical protein HGRIS_002002 [Hohenbuehelia grisea]|uniref:DUF6534 domain-containing protein n=1 Tax=Hohenbuehelia grisea TaxID=104357 RepID=A0ABR3JJ44_9AGAR